MAKRTAARACGGEQAVRKGPWTLEEDLILVSYISEHGEGSWDNLARAAGLNRNGKSCRLRWLNYLRPGVRRGSITPAEDAVIRELHAALGNKWSKIARHLPGRTDNEIKNYWRTRIQKKLLTAAAQQQARRLPTPVASDGASSSSSGSANEDGWWCMQPKVTAPQAYYRQGAMAVATTGMVKSERASSSAVSPSQGSSAAGDCWYMPPKTEPRGHCFQGAVAVATGVVKSEGASSSALASQDGYSAAGHFGMVGVDAGPQLFSSEFADSFWNAVNNFWETIPVTGAF